MEALLPSRFARIHKSYITDMNEAVRFLVHEGARYELVLRNGAILPVGRTRYKALKARWLC